MSKQPSLKIGDLIKFSGDDKKTRKELFNKIGIIVSISKSQKIFLIYSNGCLWHSPWSSFRK